MATFVLFFFIPIRFDFKKLNLYIFLTYSFVFEFCIQQQDNDSNTMVDDCQPNKKKSSEGD
ncbi:uncharacterized protein B0P05DRAFT_558223 [Gilbertella persicaria]|uniref:uncharacterized protein n=1 Tax=Gilbertella persicaria TaxID=101096 RepID=UPI002220A0FA|nr:uncharacterized protein B0P05DRAFT_558223 [Gilbertella persicaria]KAI8059962.1 hypothetical protein B0P05DRAFT_558223 [Gilbertella persicaria]